MVSGMNLIFCPPRELKYVMGLDDAGEMGTDPEVKRGKKYP